MADIGEVIQLSEGDLVLTFNKTIDLMRQVRDMLVDVLPTHSLRYSLLEAEHLLRRGIVEQSLTLGFAPIVMAEPEPVEALEPEPAPAPRKRTRRKTADAVVESPVEPAPEPQPVRRRRKTVEPEAEQAAAEPTLTRKRRATKPKAAEASS
jgi:hypothetical protein